MHAFSDRHPCFNADARKKFGRVHLPVAPRCNIQCKFCDRKFDCVNESRPGVSSGILTPFQAMAYLDHVMAEKKNIAVMGIAGPGDPFANPGATMETLRGVKSKYPELLLCVATNGLGVKPYIEELADLNVGHVTLTINAVDPTVGKDVYAWVRDGKRTIGPEAGAALLLERQLEALELLKKHGVTVKVNTILLPGINDHHIPAIAREVSKLGADIFNCIPYYKNEGSAFKDLPSPSTELLKDVRKKSSEFMPQMTHCARCRADAVGCLGESMSDTLLTALKSCSEMPSPESPSDPGPCRESASRPFVAVASREGVLVNQHLGEAGSLFVFERSGKHATLVDTRKTPARGKGDARWNDMADLLSDCHTLLVSGIGPSPKSSLSEAGIHVGVVEGMIDDALDRVWTGKSLLPMMAKPQKACGHDCSGNGMGCG